VPLSAHNYFLKTDLGALSSPIGSIGVRIPAGQTISVKQITAAGWVVFTAEAHANSLYARIKPVADAIDPQNERL